MRAFSRCGEQGLLFVCGAWASRCSGVSCCAARALERRLSSCGAQGLVAPRHVGSSRTRAQTRIPCVGRQILNHCATREAQKVTLEYVCALMLQLKLWVILSYF